MEEGKGGPCCVCKAVATCHPIYQPAHGPLPRLPAAPTHVLPGPYTSQSAVELQPWPPPALIVAIRAFVFARSHCLEHVPVRLHVS